MQKYRTEKKGYFFFQLCIKYEPTKISHRHNENNSIEIEKNQICLIENFIGAFKNANVHFQIEVHIIY